MRKRLSFFDSKYGYETTGIPFREILFILKDHRPWFPHGYSLSKIDSETFLRSQSWN